MTKGALENIAKDRFKEKPIGYEHNFELKIYQDGFAEGYEYCLESTVLTDNTETIENALNRIKELEDALEYTRKLYGDELEKAYKEINMLRQGYVWQDYDPGEGCYDDTHEGKWVKRWEPWRYVKDELPKIEVGYKVAVEVCYLDAYQNSCIKGCDWNGKDFIYQYFDGKKWIFDKKVSLLGKVFAWRYEVDDWPTLSKEVKE